MRAIAAVALVGLLVLGTTTALAQPATQASAELRDPNGQVVGSATFAEEGGGVRISVQARNLPPGPHGIHVHAVGRCDPPDFMSAGGHFNPTNRQHGLRNPAGPHAGDLPNMEIGANGTGQFNAVNNLLTLGSGPNSLFDADGSSIVIHAMPDDDVTDPAGNSGARIACGLIARTPAAAAQPAALPRTGDPAGLTGAIVPLASAGAALLLAGLALRRRIERR